jgi:hypothetical protein
MQYKKELDIKGYGKMTSLVKGLLKGKMEALKQLKAVQYLALNLGVGTLVRVKEILQSK